MVNENFQDGYILLSRSIINSEIWKKPPEYLKIFLFILVKVNHKDGLFPEGSITAKLVWSEIPDVIYLTHNDLSYCHKILLGVGTNQLEYGTYNYDETKRYNGTFKIIQTFTQGKPAQGNKDVVYYNGYLY